MWCMPRELQGATNEDVVRMPGVGSYRLPSTVVYLPEPTRRSLLTRAVYLQQRVVVIVMKQSG
jgi:hypothetical protein